MLFGKCIPGLTRRLWLVQHQAESSIPVSHVDGKKPVTWAIASAPSQGLHHRKLGSTARGRDSHGGCRCAVCCDHMAVYDACSLCKRAAECHATSWNERVLRLSLNCTVLFHSYCCFPHDSCPHLSSGSQSWSQASHPSLSSTVRTTVLTACYNNTVNLVRVRSYALQLSDECCFTSELFLLPLGHFLPSLLPFPCFLLPEKYLYILSLRHHSLEAPTHPIPALKNVLCFPTPHYIYPHFSS